MKSAALIASSLFLSIALVMMGGAIMQGLIKIRSADRYVTVKGLAEQEVKADLAIWPIQFKAADNDLGVAQEQITRQSQLITDFLKSYGIAEDEITISQLMVNDAYAQQYQQNDVATRYAIDKTMLVRTNNVDAVQKAAQKIGDLIGQGVLIGYNAVPQYSFVKLNDIKPAMIAAATQNAREAATQFANDSGATVGDIRSATQGYFSITARDDIMGMPDTASVFKKVRVVSTVEYYLND